MNTAQASTASSRITIASITSPRMRRGRYYRSVALEPRDLVQQPLPAADAVGAVGHGAVDGGGQPRPAAAAARPRRPRPGAEQPGHADGEAGRDPGRGARRGVGLV